MSTPFMQLYVADYLGDTRHLTTEQHGAYLLILMTMWRADGELPADDTKLARIAGLSVARWNKIKGDVMALLEIREGKLTQKRLRIEMKKAKEKSQKRAEAGRIGGSAKVLKDNEPAQANASRLLKHSSEPEPEVRSSSLRSDDSVAPQASLLPMEAPVFTLPTNRFETKQEEFPVFQAHIDQLAPLYPSVDVPAQLRAMKGWLIGHKDRRKTMKGMMSFITGWLAREQNKGGTHGSGSTSAAHKPSGNSFAAAIARGVDERASGSDVAGRTPGASGQADQRDQDSPGATIIDLRATTLSR